MFDSLVIDSFRANGLTPPRATIYVEDHHMKIKLAATGRFLAVVPASVLRFSTTRGSIKILPVELPTTHRPIGIITLKNITLSSPAQLFIKCVREVAKPLAENIIDVRTAPPAGRNLCGCLGIPFIGDRFPSVADILKKPVCRNLRS
jgi:LysR substrate binding domain